MELRIGAFANGDDVYIVWDVAQLLPGCRGFALQREITAGPRKGTAWVDNRIDFDGGGKAKQIGSDRSPLRRYTWTDHEVSAGDVARYRVVPAFGHGLDEQRASPWTKKVAAKNAVGGGLSCYFNRGLVISQFMSRYLAEKGLTIPAFKKQLKTAADGHEATIRTFLTGQLGAALYEVLDEARRKKRHLYAALYELSDDVLIERLASLGPRAHVVLANGSNKAGDGNALARKRLRDAKVQVFDRLLRNQGLGHNKFVVLCDGPATARQVWTGSTNWAPTGLCTQINNGLLIDHEPIAKSYLTQWKALKKSKSEFPLPLVDGNGKARRHALGDGVEVEVWFSRTAHGQDLAALRDVIDGAKDGILFLMFTPGKDGLQRAVAERLSPASPHHDPSLFVHGVVSELPGGLDHTLDDEAATVHEVDVSMVSRGVRTPPVHLEIIQPEGVAAPLAAWAAEVTHKRFTAQVGHAIVHSKLLVVDPFGKDPVVVTGSHNFSTSASSKNDENFVIIRCAPALARAYAVHVQAVYDHYRFRAWLQQGGSTGAIFDPDDWQSTQFSASKVRERRFWLDGV